MADVLTGATKDIARRAREAAYARRWRAAHPDKVAATNLARREYYQTWRDKNRARLNEYQRSWRAAHPELAYHRRYPERERKRVADQAALLHAVADGERARGCRDCGEKDLRVLEFDHVRGIKKARVAAYLNNGSVVRLYAEIDKCEVRCANCHARITDIRRKAA